ncbi:MAG: PASTA domain-containing protein [Myxococcota bacterium]
MSQPAPPVSQVLFVSVVAAMVTSALTTYALHALSPTQPDGVNESAEQVGDGEPVEVPELVELPSQAAGSTVRNVGLRLVVSGREASPLEEGRVVSQSPLAGSTLTAGDAVQVVISSGPATARIPDLVSRPTAEARVALETLGFVVVLDPTATGDAPDQVVSTAPEAGAEAEVGTTVRVRATPAGIPVPDLERTPYRRARATLEEVGLRLGSVRRRYNERLPDLIIVSQEPAAGTLVPEGTEVELLIND